MISDKMKKLVKSNSVIREMFEEGKRLKSIYGEDNVFDFSLGNPSVSPPEEFNKAVIEVIKGEDTCLVNGYMSNNGYEDVRSKVAYSINKKFDTKFTSNNIIMTGGAASGLNIVLKSILNPKEEVIVFAPYFSEYNNYIENYDGIVKVVEPNFENFEPDLIKFEEQISENTKAVIINTPNNPTGVVYSEETIKMISEIMNKKQKKFNKEIYLISDEPYREIVYDNINVPYVTKYYKNTIVVYSYSKSLSLPGERIGYVLIPEELEHSSEMIQAITISNRIIGCVNAPSLMQRVIPYCLEAKIDIGAYKDNRDLLYSIIIENNFTCIKPQGAFYLFVKTPNDDKEFCNIAKKHNILVVPGSSFACPGYVRIAYCVPYKMIKNSRKVFEQLSKELKLS